MVDLRVFVELPRIHEIIKTACELNNFKPLYHSLYIYGVGESSSASDFQLTLFSRIPAVIPVTKAASGLAAVIIGSSRA